jgi:hypothetical protein
MKLKFTILSLFLFLSVSEVIFGQSDELKVFGYFQNMYDRMTVSRDQQAPVWNENTFLMQQMNVFFAKNFGTEFSAFSSIEFTNSYNSTNNVGGMQVEEAWFKYSPSNAFNVKAGQLVPMFNLMNEIKNRNVLLPYIFRPLVYETIYNGQFGNEEFVPFYANLEVYGNLSLGSDFRFNYAGYMGNLSSDNLLKTNSGPSVGQDTSRYKMFGARFGIEKGNLALGVSGTYDRKNLWAYGIGYVPRMRFGAYLNYSIAGFEFESEYIRVYNKLSADDKTTLDKYEVANPFGAKGFDKYYWHANLLYNITDQLFLYAGVDYLKTQDNLYSMNGLKQPIELGAGYKINDSIVLKGEYIYQNALIRRATGTQNSVRNDLLLAASVSF